MNTFEQNIKAVSIAMALVLSAFVGPVVAAETESGKETTLLDSSSGYMRDYLSDPRRTGSLAGSILGGALTVHPAGTVIGSLIGFFVGKQSMFNEDKAREQQAKSLYAKRDIVPQETAGQAVPTLSFANAQGITFDTPAASAQSPATGSGLAAQGMPISPATGFSREQIAAMCGGGARTDPRFRSLCFYFHES